MWKQRRAANDDWTPRFGVHPGYGIRMFESGRIFGPSSFTEAYRALPDDEQDDRFDQWLAEFLPAVIAALGVTEIHAEFTDQGYEEVSQLPECTTGRGKTAICNPTPNVLAALLHANGYFVIKAGSTTVMVADGWEFIVVSELSDDLIAQFGEPII